ncbi:hypothetical protein ONZ45_g10983 [Pleurotus djamor]|nr:hypothetical protein ONZ45_g10983 [Pleurotus djamor]
MVKQHKRQKLETRQPLGSTDRNAKDAAEKDDEERRLEELLFGVPFAPSNKGKSKISNELDDEDQDDELRGAGGEMDGMLDTDLFFVDDGALPVSSLAQSDDGTDDEERASSSHVPVPSKPTALRKSAWTDPSDEPLSVSVSASDPSTSRRLLKLRDAPNETILSGREYERRLRRQFTKINPEPTWASKARDMVHGKVKRRRSSVSGSDGEGEVDDEEEVMVDHLLTSTSGVLKPGRRSRTLPPTNLDISRLRDANHADRRYRLFHIDGHTSPLLQTLHIPSLPPSSTSVSFHPGGTQMLLTGGRPYYFAYDLQAEKMSVSSRGLWGTTFSGANDISARLDKKTKFKRGNDGGEPIEIHTFDPTNGSILAVGGRGGYIHLVDWKSGSGQVIDSLKMSSAVKGLWWGSLPSSFSDNEGLSGGSRDYLVSLSHDSEVYIWDVGSRRCLRRWRDEGGFRGAGLMLAGSAHRMRGSLAIGSNTGLVNVYGADAISPLPEDNNSATAPSIFSQPKPQKTLGQLVTSITALRYNHDGQLLAMASKEKKDALRLIHTPTLTAFANWPTSSTPLGHVNCVDFSAGSEYMAIGNSRGKVLLYYLRNFGVEGL